MQVVYVVLSYKGFILGVYTTRASAELAIRNNPQHEGCRISTESVITN